MLPNHAVGNAALYQADCRDVLRSLADNSIDSVVTDPPYALVSITKRFANSPRNEKTENVANPYGRTGRGFMGKTWDTGEVAFSGEFWAEVLRVLKPGGHVVAFSGTRTYHRMAVAIEDAGFEIRDQLGWLYGSGFPKSHDVSKGIAKRRTEDIEPVRVVCRFIREAMDEAGLKSKDLTHLFGNCNARMIDHWAARDTDSQPSLPTSEQWCDIVSVLSLAERDGFDFVAGEVARLNDRKGTPGEKWASAAIIGEVSSTPAGFGDHRFEGDRTIRDVDGEAAAWQGWGTALKPAWEPICLARKPLVGTVAENVLEHGTGALNIDGCRVGTEGGTAFGRSADKSQTHSVGGFLNAKAGEPIDAGRWPANIVHDGSDEVLAAFPETTSGTLTPEMNVKSSTGWSGGSQANRVKGTFTANSGSAARFFYCAKASRKDRDEGLDGFEGHTDAAHRRTNIKETADNPYLRGVTVRKNTHPTVKPTELMRWLCRLVTPPGGLILDPFMGSGSTGKAALLEGFSFIGCEREDEYMQIARARIAAVAPAPANDNEPVQLALFA